MFDFSRPKYFILKLDNYFLLKIFISICVINSISTYFLDLFCLLPHLIAMVFCWVVVDIFCWVVVNLFVGFVEDLLPCPASQFHLRVSLQHQTSYVVLHIPLSTWSGRSQSTKNQQRASSITSSNPVWPCQRSRLRKGDLWANQCV